MKNVSLNKKGFTLVELLAVIVILALLIVITANTVLPMMNKSKDNAMVVYAERVLSNASASYQADTITSGSKAEKGYSIKDLMGTDAEYYGCVKVAPVSGSTDYTYTIVMYDDNNAKKIEGYTTTATITIEASGTSGAVKDYSVPTTRPTLSCATLTGTGNPYSSATLKLTK